VQPFKYKLYLVTDEKACLGRDWLAVMEDAVKGGVDLVQIREKQLPEKDFLYKTQQLKEMLDRYGVPLIVNDNIDVAMQSGAAGVHVGNNDTAPIIIKQKWPDCGILGYSIEYEEQLQTANSAASDYLALSPIFSTATKTDTVTEWGLAGIRRIRLQTQKPLVAIGNINTSNAKSIIEAGADCLAVVSAICSATNPAKAAEQLRNEIEKAIPY
jgi:thiamine-phosphate pyrophosphorylase